MRELCQHCGFEFRLSIVSNRTGIKYLRTRCCDAFLRRCPEPSELLQSDNLTPSERDYLQRLVRIGWFSGKDATVLLQLEVKINGEVSA